MPTTQEIRASVASLDWWYHTLDLGPGVTTPGFFDCRPIASRVPWPDLRGLRCLDVGTHDGFWAFEMERRGAAEVVGVDLDDYAARDWPIDVREIGPAKIAELGLEPGPGFRIATEALGSNVKRVDMNIYDLAPDRVGRFDVVFIGSLLVHLRDPVKALEAVRSVTDRYLVLSEIIDPPLEVRAKGRPAAYLEGEGVLHQWWKPNRAGLAQLVKAAGFRVERMTKPYTIPYGKGPFAHHNSMPDRVWSFLATGDRTDGAPHVGVLAAPRPVLT
ncbi:MAG: class I SAM-dependent methyltransferase [Actinobacteria bacterium]|nr:class I SAM-dependent methyltransferase [Actinomycetota bacterium]